MNDTELLLAGLHDRSRRGRGRECSPTLRVGLRPLRANCRVALNLRLNDGHRVRRMQLLEDRSEHAKPTRSVGLHSRPPSARKVRGNSGLLVGTLASLLASLAWAADERWIHLTTEGGLPGNEIQFLRERPDGAIWIGTLTGLGYYRDGKCTTLVKGCRVWDVLPAGKAQYWVGTGRGVFCVGKEQGEPALKSYSVAPLVKVGGDKVWAIAKKGQESLVIQLDAGKWAPVKVLAKEDAKDLFRTGDGRIWISVEGNGILEIPSCDAPDKAVRHLEGRNVMSFQEDRGGRVWCGTWGHGLHLLQQGQWSRHLSRERSAILDIDADRRGAIWVATSAHGLWRQHAGAWSNDLKDERGINLMEPTSDGRVWISNQARGGLRYWDGKAWKVALPGPLPMRCLLEARSGDIWVGGVLDGVHVLKK